MDINELLDGDVVLDSRDEMYRAHITWNWETNQPEPWVDDSYENCFSQPLHHSGEIYNSTDPDWPVPPLTLVLRNGARP